MTVCVEEKLICASKKHAVSISPLLLYMMANAAEFSEAALNLRMTVSTQCACAIAERKYSCADMKTKMFLKKSLLFCCSGLECSTINSSSNFSCKTSERL